VSLLGFSIYSYRSDHVCGVLIVKTGDYEKTRLNARFVLSEICSKHQAGLYSAEQMQICWERAEAQRKENEEREKARRKAEESLRDIQGDLEDAQEVLFKTIDVLTYRGDGLNTLLERSGKLSAESAEFLKVVSKQMGIIGIQC
jgi:hypothetical protein